MSRKKQHEHVNHERWLVSYADFITLLFAFFVVLFASSQSDKKKVQQIERSIHTAFDTMGIFPAMSTTPNLAGIAAGPAAAIGTAENDLDLSGKQVADLKRMKQRMERLLAAEIAQHTVAVSMGHNGLIISLREAGFFQSGSADPIPSSMNTLYAIARALAETSYDIRIEGNTDNIPIHTDRFDSNWELSTARATVLARIFIVNTHIAPARISAAGYAEFHPITSNATESGRSRNRRVDIIVLPGSPHNPRIVRALATAPQQPSPQKRVKGAATLLEAMPALAATSGHDPILKTLRSGPPPQPQPHQTVTER